MVDLFSLVLEGAASWAIGRILDAAVSCGRCGHNEPRFVNNYSTTNLLCPRCRTSLDQYTNATSHTVRRNGSVIAAYVSNVHWDSWGGFWGSPFNPHFDIDVVNSKYEDIVQRFTLSKYGAGEMFYQHERVLRPSSEHTNWNRWYKVSRDTFPDGGGTFCIDIELLNCWGDQLHSVRRLGNWSGGT